ncbi:MAG TPA: GspMb/PilO family protein [Longimicrobium sp.]|jgi:hypothetical protein
MISGISERDHRVMVAGGAAIALILLLVRGIPAWRHWDEGTRDSAFGVRVESAQREAAVRALPAMRDSAAARRARLAALTPRVVPGKSPGAGGAALASLLSEAAGESGVQLGTMQISPPDSGVHTVFTRVRVRGDATGSLPGLLRFMEMVEAGPILVSLPEWAISQPDAGGPPDRPETLRMDFAAEALTPARRLKEIQP